MKNTLWHSRKIKPEENRKIRFRVKNSDVSSLTNMEYDGLYIPEEDMFFVGFENESEDFFFSWQIISWQYIEIESKANSEKQLTAVELLERRIMNTTINVYGQMVFYYSEFKFWLDEAKAMEKEQIINFGEWYSGMEKEKVEKAYQRYLKETFKSE